MEKFNLMEKVLALDISTKTGWALIVSAEKGMKLEAHGQIKQISEPDGIYPENFVNWAYLCYEQLANLIEEFHPDVLVIEETSSGSKSIYSQKILEWTHFLMARFIKETGINRLYLMTEQWRREVGCIMTKEEKKHNKAVSDYKKKNSTKIAYNKEGKRVGRIGRKHVNIRKANEIFGSFFDSPLRKKDEDLCDALLLGAAYHKRKFGNFNVDLE